MKWFGSLIEDGRVRHSARSELVRWPPSLGSEIWACLVWSWLQFPLVHATEETKPGRAVCPVDVIES